jgi:hypothetical protein
MRLMDGQLVCDRQTGLIALVLPLSRHAYIIRCDTQFVCEECSILEGGKMIHNVTRELEEWNFRGAHSPRYVLL